ncbi:branched-chain amino acid ABC transporter permease [Microbacterium soli]|uniref:Branched-chain amino acid ABC transporter permease n=1 Tax=Microbacterium soli TaxID=446075 RepID=A0ABP7MXF3_9MICO
METLSSLLIAGLSLGSVYAVLALGFVTIFKSTGVFNLAQGSLLVMSVLVLARLEPLIGFFPALLAGVAFGGMLSGAVYLVLARRVKGPDLMVLLAILMIAVDIALTTEARREIGTQIIPVHTPWGDMTLDFLGATVPLSRVVTVCVASVLLAVFFLALRYTGWGVAMRANAEDQEAAALAGINTSRISTSAWVVGGALTVIAGVFLVSFPTPGLEIGVGVTALRALPAVMLGGVDSFGGAVVGGLIIGVVEALAAGYQHQLAFLGIGLSGVLPYVVLFVVLLWRPQGLFGSREAVRV